MGGDLGPRATIPASIEFANLHPSVHLRLYGDPFALAGLKLPSNISLQESSSVISMDESPSNALRNKLDSSMALALASLAEEVPFDACVSSGNTGALMAIGRHFLGTFQHLKRPAICKAIPTITGHSYMLDLGANATADASLLVNFALMGSALCEEIDEIRRPTVALLNIGIENSKGNNLIKEAHEILSQNRQLNYAGFIEGDSIYSGDVNVIVCDGFVGNVALKVSEGVAKMALSQLQGAFHQNLYGRLLGQIARPLLRKWHKQFEPARYNGACFLGLNGCVVKSHGAADERSFLYALELARDMSAKRLIGRLTEQCANQLIE